MHAGSSSCEKQGSGGQGSEWKIILEENSGRRIIMIGWGLNGEL